MIYLPKKWRSKASTSSVIESLNFEEMINTAIKRMPKNPKIIPHLNPFPLEGQAHSLLRRASNRFFDGHTLGKPLIERVSMDSKGFSYLGKVKLFAINSINSIYTPVISLLFSSAPFAVIRLIIAIAINSINSKPFRLLSHVNQKILKTIEPSIAYFNSSTAIVIKKLGIRISAALLHITPRVISRACCKPCFGIGFMKLIGSRRSSLTMKAAARLAIPANKVVASDRFNIPTITLANPSSSYVCHISTQNQKPCESLISQINKVGHKIISLCLTTYHNNAIKQEEFGYAL